MNVWPFIEAEEAEQHSVKRACELLEVSRAAYYERRQHDPAAASARRRRADRADQGDPRRVEGHLRGAAGPRASCAGTAIHVRQEAGGPAHGASRPGGRCPKRWRKTTIADPDAEAGPSTCIKRRLRARRRPRHPLVRRHHLHPDLGGLGLPGHRHRPRLPPGRGLGPGRPHAHRARRRRPAMACCQRRPPAGVIFHSDRGCQYTSHDFAALAAELGVTLSVGRKGECWDNAVVRELVRHLQDRAHLHPLLADHRRPPPGGVRLHRGLVQHPPPPQQPEQGVPIMVEATLWRRLGEV